MSQVANQARLYVSAGCPYSEAAREGLAWRGVDFVEYDVERDREVYERMLELTGGSRTVPVIVEEGKHVRIGWGGQGASPDVDRSLAGVSLPSAAYGLHRPGFRTTPRRTLFCTEG